MKTICMFTPTAHGGHARYTWELLQALTRQSRGNFRFELVSSEDLDPQFRSSAYPVHPILPLLKDRSEFSGKAHWVASRLAHYPRREWKLLRWLKTRPDISAVHFQEWVPWLAAPVFKRIQAMGKKVFYTCHNVYPHKYPRFIPRGVQHGLLRAACRQADGLFVLTDVLARELSSFLGPGHPPVTIAPHGVWTVPQTQRVPSVCQRLPWKRLLAFGSLRRNKGVDLLLRAAEFLPGFGITIAGEPLHRDYFDNELLPLVRRARAAGTQVNLIDRFVPDEEVPELFSTHSAVVLPYTSGFVAMSGVAFMAMAHEIPMVASEAGGLRDLFSQFPIGQTFKEHTPQALAAAVTALWANGATGNLSEQMNNAKLHFSWQQAARATIAGYAMADVTEPNPHDLVATTTSAT